MTQFGYCVFYLKNNRRRLVIHVSISSHKLFSQRSALIFTQVVCEVEMYPYVCRQAFLSSVDEVDDRSTKSKVYASKMAGGFQAGGVTFHRLVKLKRGVGMPSARHENPVKNGIRACFT